MEILSARKFAGESVSGVEELARFPFVCVNDMDHSANEEPKKESPKEEKLKEKPLEAPSEEFFDAFLSGSGTGTIDCGWCGRTHYEEKEGKDWDDGEYEELERRNTEDSDKCMFHHNGVHFGELDGKVYVYECPCNAVRQHEEWVWGHRRQIAKYIRLKTEKMVQRALEDDDAAEHLEEDVDRLDEKDEVVEEPQGEAGYGGNTGEEEESPQGQILNAKGKPISQGDWEKIQKLHNPTVSDPTGAVEKLEATEKKKMDLLRKVVQMLEPHPGSLLNASDEEIAKRFLTDMDEEHPWTEIR